MLSRATSVELASSSELSGAPVRVAQPRLASRSDGLDLARALAILLVCLAHFGSLLIPETSASFAALVYVGNAGVELFFSLSGFLIGRILIRLAQEGLDSGSICHFWARRWLRTLPLYYAVLIAVCWGIGLWDLRSFLFLQNFGFQSRPQPLIVSWSLVLEEYFYFSFPLLMLALARSSPQRLGAPRCALLVAGALAAGCALMRIGLSLLGYGGTDPSFHLNPLLRLDCAAYGVIAACVWEARSAPIRSVLALRWVRPALILAVLSFVLLDATLYIGVLRSTLFVQWIHYHEWNLFYVPSRDALLNAAFAAFVLAVAEMRLGFATGFVARWLSWLSYSIYLIHVPILFFLIPRTMPSVSPGLHLALGVVLTLAGSFLTWLLIETPFLSVRDRCIPANAR
jgi:peptidoglycan/LPS O-acetylase OafA/YrhL